MTGGARRLRRAPPHFMRLQVERGILMIGATLALGAFSAVRAQHARSPKGPVLSETRCAGSHGIGGDADGGPAPSLIGVFGRPPASGTDYLFSDALKAKSGVWDAPMLDRYLADPQAFAPGTEMDVKS